MRRIGGLYGIMLFNNCVEGINKSTKTALDISSKFSRKGAEAQRTVGNL